MWQIDVRATELIRERRAEAEAYRLATGSGRGTVVPIRARLGRALVRAGRRLQQQPGASRPARPANATA